MNEFNDRYSFNQPASNNAPSRYYQESYDNRYLSGSFKYLSIMIL